MTVSPVPSPAALPFRKMHGLGNDFVVIDARQQPLSLAQPQLERIADRRFGIGCDQLILLEPSAKGHARMRIFNPDGGEVEACGNATRCIASLLTRESGASEAVIETVPGSLWAVWKARKSRSIWACPCWIGQRFRWRANRVIPREFRWILPRSRVICPAGSRR